MIRILKNVGGDLLKTETTNTSFQNFNMSVIWHDIAAPIMAAG